MKPQYTDIKPRIDGPTKLQKFLIFSLCLTAVGMVIAAILTLVASRTKEDHRTTVSSDFPYGTLTELTALDTFMEAYLSANCNGTLLKSTQTIQVRGVMKSGDDQQEFTLIKKRPDKLIFKINHGELKITFGVSKDIVWRMIQGPAGKDQTTLLQEDEADQWLVQRRFFDRIISVHQGKGEITEITTTEWDAQTCLVVTTKEETGKLVQIIIDPQTMYPIVEQQTLSGGRIRQTVSSDFHNIQGMPIAFSIKSMTDGVLDSHIQLDSAALNTGVLSRLFDVPESFRPEPTQPRADKAQSSL